MKIEFQNSIRILGFFVPCTGHQNCLNESLATYIYQGNLMATKSPEESQSNPNISNKFVIIRLKVLPPEKIFFYTFFSITTSGEW